MCLKVFFNEKCHPPPPLDDPSLADLGTERVWPGLRLPHFRIGENKKNDPKLARKIVTDVDRNPSDCRNRIISQRCELI